MAFKKTVKGSASLETPESLLHDLRTKKIKGPLSHQADMWRSYTDTALDFKDVALQLPTGSGKTLVGLIIAEWRRRKFDEKVVYLCPTNQLVNQVVEQARDKYGLSVSGFTGQVRDYSPSDKTDYQLADKVAVTTYSALFNSNPFFNDPDVIIFDDAHASDNYISKFWSLEVSRSEHKAIFDSIVLIIKDNISASKFTQLSDPDSNNSSWVDKLPTPALLEIADELTTFLDEAVKSKDNNLNYSWAMIRDHLTACNLYFSKNQILIRPLISPTNRHLPFKNAKQRIYMSATLGKGGDLERIVGRSKIKSLPIPNGWDKQGIGRRFFIFPESSLTPAEYNKFSIDVINKNRHSLFLTTNGKTARYISEIVEKDSNAEIFNAKQIEESKRNFLESDHSIAIIANRYDGIDFPDDESRILIIDGLPTATNLQERFFTKRMGAQILLNERILTRVIQAIGRCTRSSTDYSAVIIYGEDLLSYLLSKDRRKYLHPELQAELEFGIDQSRDETVENIQENLDFFLSQSDEWNEADEGIVELRNSLKQVDLPCTDELSDAVKHEIKFQYHLWDGDFNSAKDSAMNVLSIIKDPELKGYRSLWNYLAGSACWLEGEKHNPAMIETAKEFYRTAKKTVVGLHWMVDLIQQSNSVSQNSDDKNDEVLGVIEKLERNISELGYMNNHKYDEHQLNLINGMESGSKAFEKSQVLIGEFLGYQSGNSGAQGAPDPWWILREDLIVVFEDYSNANDTSKLTVTKARQAFCHDNWIRENLPVSEGAEIIKVLVMPGKLTHEGALTHLKDVYFWDLNEYKKWVKDSLGVIRNLRKSFPREGDLVWRTQAISAYHINKLSPTLLSEKIKSVKAIDVLAEE